MDQIRQAQARDNGAARELVRRSLLAYGIEAQFDGLDAAIASLGMEGSANMVELVAESDGELVGCVAIASVGLGVAKLFGFHVDARRRGRGIGRWLLSAAIVQAKHHGASQLRLDTWGNMEVAVCLYESFGWIRVADPPPESGADRSYMLSL